MMKKLNLLIISIFVMMLTSCDFKFNPKKTIVVQDDTPYFETTELNGNYAIGSFHFRSTINSSEAEKEIFEFGKIPFQFLKNDTVKIYPKFGLEYFGDSIFKYEVTKENLIFTNIDKKIIMSYVNDNGVIRFNINHKLIDRLDIVRIN